MRPCVASPRPPAFATPGVQDRPVPLDADGADLAGRRAQAGLELLLTGEPIDARTAADWGLVNRRRPGGEPEAAVAKLVTAVARSSPLTVGIGKEAFYAQVDRSEHLAYERMKNVMTMNALANDAQEGMSAFLDKRPPEWTGS